MARSSHSDDTQPRLKTDDETGMRTRVTSAQEEPQQSIKARHVMYLLLLCFQQSNLMVWFGIVNNGLLPLISAEHGWSATQGATVLGCFALGYVPAQIPASLMAKRVGEKLIVTVNLIMNGVGCFLIAPAAALSPHLLCGVLATMGMFQACRVPVHSVLRNRWIPDGYERIWVLQGMAWAGRVIQSANIGLVPLLATSRGWRFVLRAYGAQSMAMALLWQTWAADTPAHWRGPVPMSRSERRLLEFIGRENQPRAAATTEAMAQGGAAAPSPAMAAHNHTELTPQHLPPLSLPDMLMLPATRGIFLIALLEAVFPKPFLQFDPLYLADRFSLNAVHAGAVMASTSLANSLIGPAAAVVETAMIRRQWRALDIRRWCSTIAFVATAILWLLESRVSTLALATAIRMAGSLAEGLHSAGKSLASREVAGEDAVSAEHYIHHTAPCMLMSCADAA
jgi:MFS family permease